MNLMRVGAMFAVVAAVAACKHEGGPFTTAPTPTAGLRYVNIIPDRGAVDFRIIDAVAFAPSAYAATFRTGGSPNGVPTAFLPAHLATAAGDHRIRVFWSSTNADTAKIVLLDTTLTFTAGINYTFFAYGYTTAGQTPALRAFVTADTAPDPASNVAFRALHLGPAGVPANVDVYITTAATPTGTPTFANVALGGVTGYTTVTRGALRAIVTPVATPATVTASVVAPAGVAADTVARPQLDPIAGANQAGSVITAVIVPPSLAGSTAPQTAAFLVPTVLFLIDRNPPRIMP